MATALLCWCASSFVLAPFVGRALRRSRKLPVFCDADSAAEVMPDARVLAQPGLA